MSAYLN